MGSPTERGYAAGGANAIEADNYKTTEEPIEAGANQSIVDINPAPELLSLKTTPEARVFLDGELWPTPSLRDVLLG